MSADSFTVLSTYEQSITLSKSKFIAFLFPCISEASFKESLHEIKLKHPKATHHCFALLLTNPKRERAYDDGEPSGTAGLPILGQLKSHRLINVGVVVVRYYGGTKLGVSGLIAAYKQSAAEVIANATMVSYVEHSTLIVRGDYPALMKCLSFCRQHAWRTTLTTIEGVQCLEIQCEKSEKQRIEDKISVFSNVTTYVL